MKAIAIEKFGKSDVLQIMDLPQPVCPVDKMLVRNHACGLNPLDYRVRSGQLRFLAGPKFPCIIGSDFCGEVVEAGSQVRGFTIGDRVYGFLNTLKSGSYAEFILADPHQTAVAPGNLSPVETASLPIAALTSFQAFKYQAKIKPGQHILVNGCTGGVGSFAVQIGKTMGAKVTGICSAPNMDLALELGCDHIIDYREQDVTALDQKFDLFFDAAAIYSYLKIRTRLKSRGMFITTLPGVSIFMAQALTKFLSPRNAAFTLVRSGKLDMEELNRLIESHQVKPVIEATCTMETIREAHQKLEQGHTRGKLVLKV